MRAERPAQSTIPPAPHPLASDLEGLEWWLDAHMNVASNVLCLEQRIEVSERRSIRVERCLAPLTDLRDALYELYCDAGDPRMRRRIDADDMDGRDGPLSSYVCALYALCDDVLEGLVGAASLGPRDPRALDAALGEVRVRCETFARASAETAERARRELEALPVERDNPVDPLRSARQHLGEAFDAARALLTVAASVSRGSSPGL